jgi:hypothetical protein
MLTIMSDLSPNKPLYHTSNRKTSIADEERQDHALMKSGLMAVMATLPKDEIFSEGQGKIFAYILWKIADGAEPPLRDDLNDFNYTEDLLQKNKWLVDLLVDCIVKKSFSDIRNLGTFFITFKLMLVA